MYTLAIDFGTTFTAAAVLGADGVPAMVGLGNRAMQVPSTVFVTADGAVLVGEAAERAAVADPGRARREIKRRIGDDVPVLIGGSPYSVGHLAGRVIAWAVDRCRERYGEPPTDLVLTHPATWRQFKIDVLHQAAVRAGIDDVTLCPEPVAAATFYASHARVEVGTRLCVYDLGGGTFDVCVVEKTAAGFRVLRTPGGLDKLGGNDFDESVFDPVVSELALEKPDLVDILAPAELGRLRRDCVEVKEALSSDICAVTSVVRDGRSIDVQITRSEFEDMIRPAVALTLEATGRALGSAGLQAAEVSAFVLVGGSSRIPLVAESLVGEFRRPIAQDTHPKHDVVLGATLLSPARATRPDEPAGTVPPAATGPVSARGRERGRPRRSTTLVGVSAAAVIALGGSASWVVFGVDRGSTAGVERAVGSPTDTPGETAAPTSAAQVGASPSPAPATAEPTVSTTPTTPDSPPPAGMDSVTATFLTTVCAASDDINRYTVPAFSGFPSVTDAQDAYVLVYAGRASAAQQATVGLQGLLPATIAGGRVDGAAIAANMGRLAKILSDGALALQALQPVTTQDVDTVAAEINRQAGTVPFMSMSVLTPQEQGWMTTLRGCRPAK
jgi:hypothetical protein